MNEGTLKSTSHIILRVKLTLIDAAFVLPTIGTCRDKRMMTNRLLNQDFVLQLLDVIIENYLRGEEVTDKKMLSKVSLNRSYLRFFENFQCENLRVVRSTNFVNSAERSFGDVTNDLEPVL